jgi:hypothetical protein
MVIPMGKSFFSPPSFWYWIIAIVPILSFIGSAVRAYFLWVRGVFAPLPFTVPGDDSVCLYFEMATFVSVICLLVVTWRAFRFLSRSHGTPRRSPSTNQLIAIYVVSIIGLIGIGLYGLFAFVVGQRVSLAIKVMIHIGSLLALTFFLIGSSAIWAKVNRLKTILPRWIYHSVTLLFVIGYGISVILIWNTSTSGFVMCTSVIGYLAIALVFAGFPIHAHLLFGAGFVVPFASAKKV